LAFQAVKYGHRQGWHMADWLREAHMGARKCAPLNPEHRLLYDWIMEQRQARNERSPRYGQHTDTGLGIITGYEAVQMEKDPARVAALVREHRLPWECIPSEFARDLQVQGALFERMPPTATIRQLGRLTGLGLLAPGSEHVKTACARITDGVRLARARVHPMAVYLALRTYQAGQGVRGHLSWRPVPEIVAALEAAFFAAFRARPKSQVKVVVGVDCSGSMWEGQVSGVPGLSAAEAASVMAFLQTRGNPNASVVAFSTYPQEVQFGRVETLAQIEAASKGWGVDGGTDCAQPMLWALQHRHDAEGFAVWTDDETWAGSLHPVEAVSAYRRQWGLRSKLVVASMVAHGYRTAGAQDDAGMLQVIGLDEAAPGIIDDFLAEPLV
jgi:60 kDa SS-A/Ro ribonucleoprotein